jgi:hypothetical protein
MLVGVVGSSVLKQRFSLCARGVVAEASKLMGKEDTPDETQRAYPERLVFEMP